MGLGLSGLRLGLGQRGGGKSLGSIAASYGGAAILIDAGSVFQDRSATPSTPASVGDPVGTIVGADGTYFAIAPSDGERATLAQEPWGALYLVGVTDARRYLVQTASASGFVFSGALHTAIVAAEHNSQPLSQTYAWGANAWRTSPSEKSGETFSYSVYNSSGSILALNQSGVAYNRHISALHYKNNPVYRHNAATFIGAGTIKIDEVSTLAIMSRRSDAASNGPSKFYGGVFVPGDMPEADALRCMSLLEPRVAYPATPSSSDDVVLDFQNNIFEWGGASRTLGDLTDNLDGSYTLEYTDWFSGKGAIQLDVKIPDETAQDSNRPMMRVSDGLWTATFRTPDDTASLELYLDQIATGAASVVNISPGNLAPTEGVMRITLPLWGGDVLRSFYNGSEVEYKHSDGHSWPHTNPLEITVWPDFTTGEVLRVFAKGGVASEQQLYDIRVQGVAEPIHFAADSFGSDQALELAVQQYTQDLGFVAMATTTTGGVGWDVLAPQYLAEDAAVRKSTLIMENGADETTYTPAEGIAYIDSMIAALDGHDRWMYIESNPINVGNVTPGSAWQTMQAAYRAHMGSRFIPSLTAHQCAHLDNANDIADVGNGLWPRSQTGDLTHPNDIGKDIRGQVKYGALLRLGYVTGATATVPGVPQNVTEAGGLVKWDMPTDNGNDPVREWNVYANDVLIYTGQLRQCALTLDDGEYTIGVTATNEVGEGAAAEISASVGNLIANGTMDADTDWTEVISGTGVSSTISGGVMSLTGGITPNTVYRHQAVTTAIGQGYLLTFDQTGDFGYVKVGNSANSTALGTSLSAGTGLTISFTATATTTYITLGHQNNGAAVPVYDNVSVVAV